MNPIKFKISKDLPSDEFISRNKPEFNTLLKQAPPQVSKISKWMYGGGIALATIAVITTIALIFNNLKTRDNDPKIQTSQNHRSIKPPVPDADIVPDTFRFDNEKGGTFITPQGTKINVPANTFANENNVAFTGPVDMTFREFHTPIEIYRSGIPMTYDSAGVEKTFESAGMFELMAYRNGKPIEILSGKQIRVDLASKDGRAVFNDYRYDPVANNWNYLGKNVSDPLDQKKDKNQDFTIAYSTPSNDMNTTVQAERFYKPQLAQNDAYIFKVKYNTDEFPEISIYQNVLFQVDETKQKFDPELYKVNWQKTELKNSKISGYYILKLHRPDTSVRLYVKPVFNNNDYQKAQMAYQSASEKKNEEMQQLENRQKVAVTEREEAVIKNGTNDIESMRMVIVPVTGIYNCDRPYIAPSEEYEPCFFVAGIETKPLTINWRIIGVNVLFTSRGDAKSIRIEKGASVLMWLQFQNGEIGIIEPAAFTLAIQKEKKPRFELKALNAHDAIKKLQQIN